MDEYPDPEDEFDLMHEDEYEVLRELEAAETQKIISQKTVNTSQHQEKNNASQKNNSNQQIVTVAIEQQYKSQTSPVKENELSQLKTPLVSTKKRTVEEILDIPLELFDSNLDDIFLDELDVPKKKRPCWDQPEQLMQLILDRRKMLHSDGHRTDFEKSYVNKDSTNSISRRVPLWNFVAITRNEDGERFYIRVSDKKEYVPKNNRPTKISLIKSFEKLKEEAELILLKSYEKAQIASLEPAAKESISCELWVDKYRPKRYMELLSDENVNRSLLYWLKLWDKIVFDRDPTVRARKPQVLKFKNKFKKKEEVPDHDSKGFPTQRIALLTGPPGLGKTTLAHVAARHAGYNIVELNASDDRGPEAFREALLASTQMRAVIDKDKRPNCLVLDEIDGAPAASIELLLKFIHGKLAPKGKNVKANKENDGCRRPIICICNDLYTPSLRPLRAMALVINVPEISAATLTDRLSEIARKEGLRVDSRILLQLAERSVCDVRACLGILQYTGGKPEMLRNLAFGVKDMRKGLFESWKELLQIPKTRQGVSSVYERARKVIKIAQQGETDRLVQGIFHNYPEICNDKIIRVSESLKWFQFYDEINTTVMERQSWMLMPYTNSAFVAWHLYLAGTQNPKISYPSAWFEVNQKLERNVAILTIIKKTKKMDMLTLVTEVLPYLPDLLCPKLRSVNIQLYSTKEKDELKRLVNLMLDFGLSFVQERRTEGGYEYYLDPNIWDIGTFPDCKNRKPLPYAVKQIVIQELETARLQRAAIASGEAPEKTTASSSAKPPVAPSNKSALTPKPSISTSDQTVPNHLRTLNPIQVEPAAEKKCRNFFRAFQLAGQEKLKEKRAKEKERGEVNTEKMSEAAIAKTEQQRRKDLFKSNVWFQYKEGYTNAVRRNVLMKDLL